MIAKIENAIHEIALLLRLAAGAAVLIAEIGLMSDLSWTGADAVRNPT
jgi:hypothetical protein